MTPLSDLERAAMLQEENERLKAELAAIKDKLNLLRLAMGLKEK